MNHDFSKFFTIAKDHKFLILYQWVHKIERRLTFPTTLKGNCFSKSAIEFKLLFETVAHGTSPSKPCKEIYRVNTQRANSKSREYVNNVLVREMTSSATKSLQNLFDRANCRGKQLFSLFFYRRKFISIN